MKQYSVNVPVMIMKEGKQYVAYTPAFDLSTSGRTLSQAKERFNEAVQIFVEELDEMGTLDRVLKDLGWTKAKKTWQAPRLVSHASERVRFPV